MNNIRMTHAGRLRLPALILALAMLAITPVMDQPESALAQNSVPGTPGISARATGETWVTIGWSGPTNTGGSAITAYDLRYKVATSTAWTTLSSVWTTGSRRYTVRNLTTGTQYNFAVRAVNSTGDGPWASVNDTPTDAPSTRSNTAPLLDLQELSSGLLDPSVENVYPGSLGSATDVDYYRLSIESSQISGTYGFWIYSRSNIDMKGAIYERGNRRFNTSDHGGQDHNPEDFFSRTELSPGVYHIEVSGYDGATGDYEINVRAFPEGSSGRSNAIDLPLGQAARGNIHPAGDEDYYKITLTARTDVILRASGGRDTVGELQNTSGTKIAENDDSLFPQDVFNFLIRETLNAGVYYLRVKNYNEGITGAYTVHASTAGSPGSSTSTAQALTLDEARGGNISSAGDSDHFSITVAQDTYATIWALHESDSLDADGELLNNSGQAVTEDFLHDMAGDAGFGIEHLLTPGTHHLKVTGDGGTSTGVYTVLATENQTFNRVADRCSGKSRSPGINDALSGCQWHLNNTGQFSGGAGQDINVEPVWTSGNLGGDVNVAVVDAGINGQHPDLVDNVVAASNHDYNGRDIVYYPLHNHGTAVAGIIAARDNSIGVRGVAPRASIYAYNLLVDEAENQSVSNMNRADAMSRNAAATAVSNNSWGPGDNGVHEPADSFWRAAIETGVRDGHNGKGTFYVWAGGNGGRDNDYSNLDEFANQWGVTAVCAVNHKDVRAAYSERGSNLWVCAPSSDGYKMPGIATTGNQGRYMDHFTGTSAAVPQVSGLAALLRKANPALTWRDLKLIMAASARKNDPADSGWEPGGYRYGSTTDQYQFNHQYGFGVIDAQAAVNLAADWNTAPALRQSVGVASGGSLSIPDATTLMAGSRVQSAITLNDDVEFIEYVTLHTQFDHDSFRDLEVELVAPSGRVSKLVPEYDDSSDAALHFFPTDPLDGTFRLGTSKHLGESAEGVWTLRMRDFYSVDSGELASWSITAYGHRMRPEIPMVLPLTQHSAGGLTITWTEPSDPGASEITAYDARYIRSDATDKADENWTSRNGIWTEGNLIYHLNALEAQTEYDVQVLAVNARSKGKWSETRTETTGDNVLPAVSGCSLPDLTSRSLAWHGVLTAGKSAVPAKDSKPEEMIGWGHYNNVGAISRKDIPMVLGGNSYTIGDLLMQFDIAESIQALIAAPDGALALNLSSSLTAVEQEDLVLHVCGQEFAFAEADRPEGHDDPDPPGLINWKDNDYYWQDSGLTWTNGTSRLIVMSIPESSEAMSARAKAPPFITRAPGISPAGKDRLWTGGEDVEITITFSEAVTVDASGGAPSIGVTLGGTEERTAGYLRADGTAELIFRYTLTPDDGDHSSIQVPGNSLALNGGTIRSQATQTGARLEHNGAAVLAPAGKGKSVQPPEESPDSGPSARFREAPQTHDGEQPFRVELHLSPEPDGLSYRTLREALETTGASVSKVQRRTAGKDDIWVITVTPSQGGDITIRLPALECSQDYAVCINGQPLVETASAVIEGLPFTAKFAHVPAEHNGENSFEVHLHFSHEPAQGFSYRTVLEGLLDLEGGRIDRVWRLKAGNRLWGIAATPLGLENTSIMVRETTGCETEHAVCDAAGRKLPGGLGAIIIGPPTLSVSDGNIQGETLAFRVSLSRPLSNRVTADYATHDGTAASGQDYTETSGTLTFEPETRVQTIIVPVTGPQDEGAERKTLTMTLSDPSPERVRIANGTATGAIP